MVNESILHGGHSPLSDKFNKKAKVIKRGGKGLKKRGKGGNKNRLSLSDPTDIDMKSRLSKNSRPKKLAKRRKLSCSVEQALNFILENYNTENFMPPRDIVEEVHQISAQICKKTFDKWFISLQEHLSHRLVVIREENVNEILKFIEEIR